MIRKITQTLLLILFFNVSIHSQNLELLSPNEEILIHVSIGKAMSFRTFNQGQ